MQLFVMKADGSNLTAVTDGAGELNVLPQWDGNGQAVYFYQLRPTLTFRRVSVAGGTSRQIAPWSLRREYQAAVDPRERLVVYSAVEYGRLQESRAHDLESGRETRLPFALAEQRFSRDGRFIAGESRDHEVVVCETVGHCRVLTPKSARGLTTLAWSADDSRLFLPQIHECTSGGRTHVRQYSWWPGEGARTDWSIPAGFSDGHGRVAAR